MKYSIVSGSSRQDSQSIKVSNYIKAFIEKMLGHNPCILDMSRVVIKIQRYVTFQSILL